LYLDFRVAVKWRCITTRPYSAISFSVHMDTISD
jgi:hypothetical protein